MDNKELNINGKVLTELCNKYNINYETATVKKDFTAMDMIEFAKHILLVSKNESLHDVSYCDGSYQRHQESLHDEINEVLSKRSFSNEELQLILDVIKNVDSFNQVFKIINSCS